MPAYDIYMLTDAVRAALAELGPAATDSGTAELALTYASQIDLGIVELDKAGPQLLAVLDALLMTPKARAAAMKGAKNERNASPLDELRARRAARQRDPSTVDTTAS